MVSSLFVLFILENLSTSSPQDFPKFYRLSSTVFVFVKLFELFEIDESLLGDTFHFCRVSTNCCNSQNKN